MKKVLISMLLVILTLCLFVSCNSDIAYTITFDGLYEGEFTVACKENDTWESYFGKSGREIAIDGTEYIIKTNDVGVDLYDDQDTYLCYLFYNNKDLEPSGKISSFDSLTITTLTEER